jgi:cobalt-zinc-cadmium efflux system membrane fusion protein
MNDRRARRMRAGLLGLAALVAVAAACGGGETGPWSEGDGAGSGEARGPHGGRLLEDGAFALEVTIYERGVPPQFRLYPFDDGKPIPPAEVSARATLDRLGGRSDVIRFRPEADYLLGDAVVEEPHSFAVSVEATWRATSHRWTYEQIEGRIVLPDGALRSAGIEVATAGPVVLTPALELPGQVGLNQDRVAQIAPRLPGMVIEVRKNVGDQVEAGDVMAAIDSPQLAEVKNEYIQSVHALEFAQATYVREERLWKRRISPEQDVLLAKHRLEEAEIARQIAEQKLLALGVPRGTLAELAIEPEGSVVDRRVREPFPAGMLTRYDVRSAIAGEVIEKHLTLGESVQADTPIYVVADLSTVWVDIAVYATDIGLVRIGQPATVRSAAAGLEATAIVSYVGPLVGTETRSARARVVLPNPEGKWRPGLFVTVSLVEAEVPVPVAVPADAIQTIRDWSAVFVRYGDEFEVRPVEVGRRDGGWVEILKGLAPGERYASRGSFVLKADLGKGAARHED